ncbi:MAG: PHP domain-containing protein [Bacteroidota bacterium]|nr:PHP domain-containing protein [Bacteroidota bacterium]
MKTYRADLHIHSVLSPCGDLDMSPVTIIEKAQEAHLDIIGITDHNSTRQCPLIKSLGQKAGILVLCGAEVTSHEEVHCLALFENDKELLLFQNYLDLHLPNFPNNTELFGYQVVVDENDFIIYEEEKLLISAINQNINEIEKMVHSLNGLFIPAHIDKLSNSLLSQLGFIPSDLIVDAIEVTSHADIGQLQKRPDLQNKGFIRNSDAHYPGQIGSAFTLFELESPSFQEILLALKNQNNRRICI